MAGNASESACAVDECVKPRKVRDWCVAHYKRWRRWGTPMGARTTTPADVRFWAKVNKDGPLPPTFRHRGPCWLWTAGANGQGYGMFHPTKTTHVLVHRYAYEALRGPIPVGLVIDHLCRVRRCVNPRHLEPVPMGVNTLRGLSVSTFNRLKTHCPANHEYTPENTYRSPSKPTGRRCRECAREADRRRDPNAARKRRNAQRRAESEAA